MLQEKKLISSRLKRHHLKYGESEDDWYDGRILQLSCSSEANILLGMKLHAEDRVLHPETLAYKKVERDPHRVSD